MTHKEKALAETAALLVLSKKARAIWGNTGRLLIPKDRQMAVNLIDEAITSGARLYQTCDVLFIHPKTYRS